MEPQINRELPNVGGNFSSGDFENIVPVVQNPQNAEIFGASGERHEVAFSPVEQFQQNFEQVLPEPQVQVVVPQVQLIQAPAVSVPASTPPTAKDIDLMEDEWVKDLKKMIVETKGDPFSRQVRFKEMQVDYLKKRYNRTINGGK